MAHGEGESEVDRFFCQRFVLVYVFEELNFLFVLEEADFADDFWGVFSGAFDVRAPSVSCMFYRYEMALPGGVNLQLRLWRDDAVLEDAVRLLIAAAHVEILPE